MVGLGEPFDPLGGGGELDPVPGLAGPDGEAGREVGLAGAGRAEQTLPDVIVLDIGMPKRGGIDACRIIKQRVPSVLILMLTSSDDDADLFEAIRAGANGYLLKTVTEDIATGIRGVVNGESQLSPAMATKLLAEFKQLSQAPSAPPFHPGLEVRPRLTSREIDILQRVAQGRLNREIAAGLGISEHTVRSHIRNILDKLQMHSRMEAAMYAVRQRLSPFAVGCLHGRRSRRPRAVEGQGGVLG